MSNLLPPNATLLERNLATVNARLGDLPVGLRDLIRPETCPAEFLPWLGQMLSVDSWEMDWTEGQRRDTIKASLGVHKVKGTIGAVRRALSALGIESQLQEWFNQIPAAAPYTFHLLVTADQVGFDQATLRSVSKVLASTKNLRSHLTGITPQAVTRAETTVAGTAAIGAEITTTDFTYSLIADGSAGPANGTYMAKGFRLPMQPPDGSLTLNGSATLSGWKLGEN